ncbi:MAG: HAD family hydrolase [Clostridia bacterium]|nr:HAD family hydrolase [Clostridia bacterium]
MLKAALFDLDGTLTNTLADIAHAMNRALRLHGLPEWPVDAYRYLVGDGAKVLSERCVREQTALAPSVRQAYQAYYETHNLIMTRPYEGIAQMLQALQARGVKLAVFSNKPDADTKNVVRHFFPQTDWCVIRGQVEGVPVKPDPTGALLAARAMGAAPEEVLYLGDTATDMRCAVAAGMYPVGAAWGFRTEDELRQNGAQLIAHTPADVIGVWKM